MTDIENIFDELDSSNALLKEDWKGEILFHFAPICYVDGLLPTEVGNMIDIVEYKELNMCKYLESPDFHNRLYFDKGKYFVELENLHSPFKTTAFTKLKTDLSLATNRCGSPVYCNGGPVAFKSFTCSVCDRRRNKNKTIREGKNPKGTEIPVDHIDWQRQKNRREDGKAMRSKTHIKDFTTKNVLLDFK